nr:hypothetical protein [Bacteroides xylanisolvens]
MDYMQLLYLQPTQKLPIVLLVSEDATQAKDVLNFLKAVFENNVTFNTNEDFRSHSILTGQKAANRWDEVLLTAGKTANVEKQSTTFTTRWKPKAKTERRLLSLQVRARFQQRISAHTHRRRKTRYWCGRLPLQSVIPTFCKT